MAWQRPAVVESMPAARMPLDMPVILRKGQLHAHTDARCVLEDSQLQTYLAVLPVRCELLHFVPPSHSFDLSVGCS